MNAFYACRLNIKEGNSEIERLATLSTKIIIMFFDSWHNTLEKIKEILKMNKNTEFYK